MKTAIKQVFFFALLVASAHFTSCLPVDGESGTVGPKCSGYGYLKMTNESINTIQVIIIDGTRYGSLSPGQSEIYKLAVGRHNYESRSANGKGGCSPASVTIVECDTVGRQCRG